MRAPPESPPPPGYDLSRQHGAEEQLRRSEERFRNIFDHAPIGILILGPDVRIQRVNRALCTMLGYREEEMLGHAVTEFLHPDDHPESDRLRGRVLTGQIDHIATERRALRKDGHVLWLRVQSTVQRHADGQVDIVISQLIDVTEQRAQEAQLRENEARLRTTFEMAPIGMALIAPNGVLLQVNRALETMMGHAGGTLQGRMVMDLIHADDRAPNQTQADSALAGTNDTIAGESRYVRPDGQVVWGAYRSSLVHDADGTPRYFVSQVIDITERKLAEEALRDSENRYRGLVELSHDLIVRMDLVGNLTFVNDAWCAKFGLRREEAIGRSVMPRVVKADRPATALGLQALAAPPHRTRVEIRQTTVEGERWLEWEGCGIFDDAGRVVELQAIGRDITQDHAAADALHASLEELRQSEEKLRLLAQRQVAIREEERKRVGFDLHDGVCQELIGIGILVESIRGRHRTVLAESGAEFTRVSRYLSEVVEHLRLLAGELRPMLLQDLGLEGSLRSLALGLASNGTSIEAIFPTVVPRLEEAAEVTVYRIAQEALTNALRHAQARCVTLELAADTTRLRLVVRDDGRGFDPSRRRTSALGLLSMEERALALGGRLDVTSVLGRGTTVALDCPLVEPPRSRAG